MKDVMSFFIYLKTLLADAAVCLMEKKGVIWPVNLYNIFLWNIHHSSVCNFFLPKKFFWEDEEEKKKYYSYLTKECAKFKFVTVGQLSLSSFTYTLWPCLMRFYFAKKNRVNRNSCKEISNFQFIKVNSNKKIVY